MTVPGNFLDDNWYMGYAPVEIDTLGDLLDRTDTFTGSYPLRDASGDKLQLRMGKGVLIIEKRQQKGG